MTSVGGSEPRRNRERAKVRVETVPQTPPNAAGEVYEEGGQLVGTFFLPVHRPPDLKYHVGRRTLTLWSRKEGAEFQTILVLPKWVRPDTFILRHKNGVYEFVLQVAEDRPSLPGA